MADTQAYAFSALLGRDVSVFGWGHVLGLPIVPSWDRFPSGAYEFELITAHGEADMLLSSAKLRWRYASPPPLSWAGFNGAYRFLGSWNEERPRLSEPEYWSRVITEYRDDAPALIRTLAHFD